MGPQTPAVVSPIPEGSARHGDVHTLPWRASAGGLQSAACGRDGASAVALIGASSNWGLGGTDQGTLVTYLGASMYQVRGGVIVHALRVPWVTTKPAAITKWRDGLYVVEVVLAWPNDAVGADNGLIIGFVDNAANLRRSVSAGIITVENDTAGVIRIAVNGATGVAFTNLAVAPAALTKVRVEIRHATRDNDGSISVFINDSSAPSKVVTTADANFLAKGAGVNGVLNIGLGSGSAVNYVNVMDWNVWRGPDTTIGM